MSEKMENEKLTSRRRFLKYLGTAAAGLGVGALLGSRFSPPVHATPPASTTVQGDVISTYLYTGPAGTYAYTYNPDGTVANYTYGGLTATYTYNTDGTIATIVYTLGSVTVTDTYSYSAGSISSVVRT